MRLWDSINGLLRAPFERSSLVSSEPSLEGPDAVIWPGVDASLEDHVNFIIESKKYIAEHDVPEDRAKSNNQYSHAGKEPINPEDTSKPALTNCSYEHFGRQVVSFGFPLFVKQAPLFTENGINHSFSGGILWESVSKVMDRYDVNPKDGSLKAGYYLPTNHYYMESKVSEDKAKGAEEVIEFITRTDITDPKEFIAALDQKMGAIGYQPDDVKATADLEV